MIEPEALFPLDLPLTQVAGELRVKAVGPDDSLPVTEGVTLTVSARALRPLSPVHLDVARGEEGDLTFRWKRRSRIGFAWTDGVDAPLGEESEAYAVRIASDGYTIERITHAPSLRLTAADRQAAFGSASGSLSVDVAS